MRGVEMVERMAGTSLYERAEHATRIIRARTNVEPRIAVVLGSGLGGFADDFEEAVAIPYEEIPGFVRSTAEGHAGRLVIGKIDSVPQFLRIAQVVNARRPEGL